MSSPAGPGIISVENHAVVLALCRSCKIIRYILLVLQHTDMAFLRKGVPVWFQADQLWCYWGEQNDVECSNLVTMDVCS